MKTSESIAQIAAALAAAQGEFKNPEANKEVRVKTREGAGYAYKYATLPAVFDITRAALSKNAISHSFGTTTDDKGRTISSCRIIHKSGEWIESEMLLAPTNDPKAIASQLTYFRRHLFNGLVGIAGDEDLDGEPQEGRVADQGTGSDHKGTKGPQSPADVTSPSGPTANPNVISDAQRKRLRALQGNSGMSDELLKELILACGFKSSKDITRSRYDEICNRVESFGKGVK